MERAEGRRVEARPTSRMGRRNPNWASWRRSSCGFPSAAKPPKTQRMDQFFSTEFDCLNCWQLLGREASASNCYLWRQHTQAFRGISLDGFDVLAVLKEGFPNELMASSGCPSLRL